jgi:hypothetical protein
MDEERYTLASKTFDDIIVDGFRLFSKTYKTLIIPLAIFSIFSILSTTLLLTDLRLLSAQSFSKAILILDKFSDFSYMPTDSEMDIVMQALIGLIINLTFEMVISSIFTIIAICSVSNYVYKKYLNKDPKFKEEFKAAFNSKLLLVILLLGIGVPLGIFLILIPSVIIIGYYIFYVFTFNSKENDNTLRLTRSISKGAFMRIIGIFLICSLFAYFISFLYESILGLVLNVPSSVYNSWVNPNTRNFGMLFIYELVYAIPEIILAPVFICLITPLFASHKARFELGYQYQQQKYPRWRVQYERDTPRSPIIYEQEIDKEFESKIETTEEKKGGYYCPFCGYYVSSPKKYCTSCGESLDFKI